jgi:anti-sigma B factor antagonist
LRRKTDERSILRVVEANLNIEERLAQDVAVLTLTGQMLLDDGDLAFGRRISDLAGRGIVKIVLDLGGVSYIDSSGVGMMAAKLKHVRERGGDIRLLHLSSRGQRLLGMLKILTVFETFDDEAAAIRSFSARPGG